jgi:hypothetical protein
MNAGPTLEDEYEAEYSKAALQARFSALKLIMGNLYRDQITAGMVDESDNEVSLLNELPPGVNHPDYARIHNKLHLRLAGELIQGISAFQQGERLPSSVAFLWHVYQELMDRYDATTA